VAAALVTFEDKRFYRHVGFDVRAIARAARRNLREGRAVEGGSTITMQVIRLSRKSKERTFFEKIVEMALATRLELKHSKKEILALYASHAPFGGNVVGIDAAAWRYFGRDVRQLSWAEAATLAVLPNSPAMIHLARNRQQLLEKRNRLLDKLHVKGYLDADDLLLAKSEPLPDKPLPLPMLAPHLLSAVAKQKNTQRVATTLNAPLQRAASQVVNSYAQSYKANKIHNAAAIIVEVESGKVLAYVGNVTDLDDNINGSNVDIIVAPRSSGSILKPFLYAAMLDDGMILPRTLVPDYPLYTAGFAPSNFGKTFDGAVPAQDALSRSLNVPTVRMLQSYSVEKLHRLLRQLGMTTLTRNPEHYGLSLILGGAENTLWDIVGMYAYMGRMVNRYVQLSSMYDMSDLHAPVVFQSAVPKKKKPQVEQDGILNAAAVWQTLEILQNVNRHEEEAAWQSFSSSRRVAWKTGTSYGHRDAWAVGLTPKYAVGVWVGNANGEGRPLLTGVGYAAPILFELFGLLPHHNEWFPQPYDDMVQEATCRLSGHRANSHCPEVDSVWISAAGISSQVCPYHVPITLDRQGRYRVNSSCYAVADMLSATWFVLPPAQEFYYRQRHHDYQMLPPLLRGCATDESQQPIDVIYPVENTTMMLTRQLDGGEGKSVFRAAHRDENAVIFWHINQEYVGSTQGQHTLALKPPVGEHTLYLVDNLGHSRTVRFSVKE
jgi:penicillin-binding protein 1C